MAAASWGSALPTGWQRLAVVGRRRAFSLTFPAGGMVLFIHWRVVAEESDAANSALGAGDFFFME